MKLAAFAFLLLGSGSALAQTAPAAPPPASSALEFETVHSTGIMTREEIISLSLRFVQSIMPPSYKMDGQYTKWKGPVCPRVFGLTPAAAYIVERRIREVAENAGAQVDRRDPCPPNVRIFVTPEPQATLDTIAAHDIRMFEGAPLRELTLRYPVQSWYFGYVVDANNNVRWDIDCWMHPMDPECRERVQAYGNRMRTGVQPQMAVATILVDAKAITGATLGSLGDYLALMTLAQAPARGRCQPVPSIANFFLKDCQAGFHVTALSQADLAMLKALYETPDEPERLQGVRLIQNMRKNLEAEQQN